MLIFASIIPSLYISMGIAENTFRSVDKMMNRYGPVSCCFYPGICLRGRDFSQECTCARDWLVIFSRAFPISLAASVIGVPVESVPTLIHLFMRVACDWSIGPLKSVLSAFLVVVHWLVGTALPACSCTGRSLGSCSQSVGVESQLMVVEGN